MSDSKWTLRRAARLGIASGLVLACIIFAGLMIFAGAKS